MIRISKNMQQGENILYYGTPSWWSQTGRLLLFWLFLIPVIIAVFDKYFTKYIVTDRRIFESKGIIVLKTKSAMYKYITTVAVHQSIIGKAFNYGDLFIDTSGSGTGLEFQWRYIKDPFKVKNLIEHKVHEAQSRR
jgi:uncharacterized membrane protein YdbT with pleckstrin-like domain